MPSKKTAQAAPSSGKAEDEIRKLAQKIYTERQSKKMPGDELSDWLAAEAKVKAKRGK